MKHENVSLFLRKKELINETPEYSHLSHSVTVVLHGIELVFHVESDECAKIISSKFEKSKLPSKTQINIYLKSPEDLSISLEEWGDESSQDCWNENVDGFRIGVQRDFVSRELENRIYYAMLSPTCDDGLFNFLRWLLPSFLLEDNQAILHSAAVLTKSRKALFFLGYSGAGKTTMTSLAGNREILGDDMNRLYFDNERVYAGAGGVGGAFEPSVSIDQGFPVAALFWLKQSDRNSIQQLSKIVTFQHLFSSFVGWSWEATDKPLQQRMMRFIEQAADSLPMYELEFTKSETIWNEIERII